MIKTFSFRIKDSTCSKHLELMARSVNVVWNFCNETQLHALRWGKKWPTGYDLNKLTSGTSKELEIHAQTIQAVCQEYEFRRKSAKKRKLRWRGKRSLGWIPFKKLSVQLKGDCVTYCKRKFRFWKHREIEGTIRCGNFSQDARGRWYLNLVCKIEETIPTLGTNHIGIDLGLKDFATCSNGEKFEAQREFRKLEEKLGKVQRAKKKKQIKTIHAKIRNRRKDWLHKLSSRLVKENELIVIGNVSSSKLAKTKMAKSVLDAGWSMFKTFLSYKAIAQKVMFVEINEAFSSRSCSKCKSLSGPRGLKGLGLREWVCSDCGAIHDRDVNAALNILALGYESLALK